MRQVTVDHAIVRSASKRLFNSQYRIEVAELVGTMHETFTTQDLEAALQTSAGQLPWSCVTKELAVLVSVGLVTRDTSRTPDGRIPYARGSAFPAFLSFIRQIHPPALHTVTELPISNVTPMRRRGADS
jgi:hypothetical protein